MNQQKYIAEIEKRLHRHFVTARDGYKVSDAERYRLEGFIQGAIFLGFATSNELSELMNTIHISVYGKSIKERQAENPIRWQASSIDYSKYEQPAYERNGG